MLAAIVRHRGIEEHEVLPFLFHLVIAAGIFLDYRLWGIARLGGEKDQPRNMLAMEFAANGLPPLFR